MKILKRVSAAALTGLIIFSLIATVISAAGQPSSYSVSKNSGERDVVCTTLSGTNASSYYTGSNTYSNLSSLSSSALLSSLRTLMKSTHKKETSYNECKSYASSTDCQNEDGTVIYQGLTYIPENIRIDEATEFSGECIVCELSCTSDGGYPWLWIDFLTLSDGTHAAEVSGLIPGQGSIELNHFYRPEEFSGYQKILLTE